MYGAFMLSPFQPTTLVGAIAMVLGLSTSAFANQSNNQKVSKHLLETLVTTATRSEQNIENVPARISVIDEKTIQQSPSDDLGHLLQREAALNIVQMGGIGQSTSGFIRGTESRHILFIKDGASLNTALDGGSSIPYIDLSDASQIEILKGPASVQYGTDAIGGVINVRTAPPQTSKAFVTGDIGENKTYKTIIGADATENGFYTQLRAQRLESEGTPVTNKDTKRAPYDQKGYSAKFGYEQDQYGASISLNENKGTNVYHGGSHDFLNRLTNLNAHYELSSTLSLNARYSNFKDELIGKTYTTHFNTERNEGDVNLKWKLSEHQNLLVGASINNADITSLSIVGLKRDLNSTGYYVQHQYDTDIVHTQAGIRIEDNAQFGTHTVGQLAGRFQVAPLTSIYANVGTAFKAPTGNQLYYIYEDVVWGNTYGNPNLKPETSVSYELGIDQQLPYGFSGSGSIYQTNIKNLIDYIDEYPISTYRNDSEAKIIGGEVGLKWAKDDFFWSTEYAYVKTKNQDSGTELIRRPRQSLTLSIGLENERYGVNAAFSAKSKSKLSGDVNSKKMPGYAVVDLNAYWNLHPNLKLFTSIKNVGDVQYKTANYYDDEFYINGGRLASFGITVKY